MKSMIRKITSLVAGCILIGLLGVLTFADGNSIIGEIAPIDSNEINVLNVRSTVLLYFSEREALLQGNATAISAALPAVTTDELSHKGRMEDYNVEFVESSVTIESIECPDERFAYADVVETMTYKKDGIAQTEEVPHKLYITKLIGGGLIVGSDGYTVEFSGFNSCSYVPINIVETTSSGYGSKLCITYVAKNEIGYTEDANGSTKYNTWAGVSGGWCVMYLTWCAEQAGVSRDVVPKMGGTSVFRSFYANKGLYYASASQGGTYTPKTGDFFHYYSGGDHYGIITAILGNTITTAEGNWGDAVVSRQLSLTDSAILGYCNPQYVHISHEYPGTYHYTVDGHWRECQCGYTTTITDHYNNGVQYDAANHWYECVCGYAMNTTIHTLRMLYEGNYHWRKCNCGYVTGRELHTLQYDYVYECYVCVLCAYTN